ncbi:MAG: DUF4907 domain-containing protein [Bacteroidota bacterium]
MTKLQKLLLLICLVLGLIWIVSDYLMGVPKSPPLTTTPIKLEHGWGYSIELEGKTIIRQENIPSVAGEDSFRSREDALVVGSWVSQQLVEGKSPSLTSEILNTLIERP